MDIDLKSVYLILLLLIVIVLAVSFRVAGMQVACTKTYGPAITVSVTQSQGVFSDKRRICENSYYAVTDLDMCLSKTDESLPAEVMNVIRPIVSNISVFLRNETKDITSLKAEHDERCKDYSQFMFLLPELP